MGTGGLDRMGGRPSATRLSLSTAAKLDAGPENRVFTASRILPDDFEARRRLTSVYLSSGSPVRALTLPYTPRLPLTLTAPCGYKVPVTPALRRRRLALRLPRLPAGPSNPTTRQPDAGVVFVDIHT